MKANFKVSENNINAGFKLSESVIQANLQVQNVVKADNFATNERVDSIVETFDNNIDSINNEIVELIKNKAEKSNTYTKTEVDNKLSHLDIDTYSKDEIDTLLDTKQIKGDYATVTAVTEQYNELTRDIDDLSEIVESKANLSDIPDVSIYATTQSLDITNQNIDALTGDIENISGELDAKQPIGDYATNSRVNEVENKIPSLIGYATETYVQGYHDNTKQDIIEDLSTIRTGAGLGATALQNTNDCVHKANAETITGIKTFNGGKIASGSQPSLIATNGFYAGGYSITGWADISCHRLCNNQINTGSYYINSDGSVIFRHKTGTALAEGSANDGIFTVHWSGIKAGFSGKAGQSVAETHDVLIDTVEYSKLNTTAKDIIGAINELYSLIANK